MQRLRALTQRQSESGPRQTTWENLPFEFKVMVKDHLDVNSRNALRCCSKSDRDVVDSGPHTLVKLEIQSELKQFLKHTQFSCGTTKKRVTVARRYATSTSWVKMGTDDAVDKIMRAFKNRHSVVDQIVLNSERKYLKGIEKLMTKLMRAIEIRRALHYTYLWKVKQLKWIGPLQCPLFFQFLGQLDPQYLHTLYIIGDISVDREVFEAMKNTVQWKALKECRITSPLELHLDTFHHFAKMEIQVPKLEVHMFLEFIQKFMDKTLLTLSYFMIGSFTPMAFEWRLPILQHFFRNAFIELKGEVHHITQRPIHRFQLPRDPEKVLVVNFTENSIIGMVAGKNSVTDAFIIFLMRMNTRFTWMQ